MNAWRVLPATYGAAALVSALAMTQGCADSPLVCTAEVRPGLAIEVRDSLTGTPRAEQTFGLVRSGRFLDTLEGDSLVLVGAWERAGTYAVDLERWGYLAWRRTEVTVPKDECHVQTVALQARLQPWEFEGLVTADRSQLVPGDTVHLTLTVTNIGDGPGFVTGGSNCVFDYHVLSGDSVVARAAYRVCLLDIREYWMDPGESVAEQLWWDGYTITETTRAPAPPGSYTIAGVALVPDGTVLSWRSAEVTVNAP
jgi:hypothetical protein